jgi:enamine deaminase RidA (YjgF/YER057c/UK114 family)
MPYDTLESLGLALPDVPEPAGNYVPFARCGDLAYLAGQVPRHADGTLACGRLGAGLDVAEGAEHARLATLALLAVLERAAGSLHAVERIVKVFGMVNATPEFKQHPAVIDGCSDLLVAVFGERGRHARSAVGMASLPGNVSVEIELIAELRGAR